MEPTLTLLEQNKTVQHPHGATVDIKNFNFSFHATMVGIKFCSWEDFLNNNRKKEDYKKEIKDIGNNFYALAPDHAK